MPNRNRVVALIPARAGSKRLPNKNILPLSGKPLIAWTIEAALNSQYIDEVVVSTDSELIREVSKKYGATVPFLRPEAISGDMATTDAVLLHAIAELGLSDSDTLILLQPTSPLRDFIDIDKALALLSEPDVLGVVSVCECEHSPLWANTLPDNLNMGEFINPEVALSRSQDLPVYYRLNGAIYAYGVSFLNKYKKRHYTDGIKASIMDIEHSIDIDNEFDFAMATYFTH